MEAIATASVKRKLEAKRERRRKANKSCTVCGTKLSIYGEGNTCSLHTNPRRLASTLDEIKRLK